MRLLIVGDSFTYGEELNDLTNAWPNLLTHRVGCELTNLSRPGSGNTRMVRHCIEQVNNYDIAIIAWSHFARTELSDENGFYDLWPGCNPLPHEEHSPWRKEIINYYSKHHNDDYLYRQYLLNIILIQNFFKANNKSYLMLDSFGNHQYTDRRSTNTDLFAQIDSKFYVGWPDTTMMEWTYGVEIGPRGHFLEHGHKIVADKIYKHMVDLTCLF
jgi:hypothetical protein